MGRKPTQPRLIENGRVVSDDPSLLRLLKDIRSYAHFDTRVTNDLVRRASEGDLSARDKLIKGNSRLILKIAKDFTCKPDVMLDLFQEGALALCEAMQRFDPSLDVPFVNYAAWWIRKKMVMFIHSLKTIRTPESMIYKMGKTELASQLFMQSEQREPDAEELASITKMNGKTAKSVIDSMSLSTVSDINLDELPSEEGI